MLSSIPLYTGQLTLKNVSEREREKKKKTKTGRETERKRKILVFSLKILRIEYLITF